MIVTNHAYKRIKQRCGLNKKSVDKLMEELKYKGIDRRNVNGNLRKYMDYLWHQDLESKRLVLFNSYVFIFEGSLLITVWLVPMHLKNSSISQCKKLIDSVAV